MIANFDEGNLDLEKIIPKALQDENLALEMIAAGQKVMQNAISSAASKHRKTGAMASSVKCGKPYIDDKTGSAKGKVNISGKDSNGMSNAQKALFIEYGTYGNPARPFVRPAIKSCENSVNSAMKSVFDKAVQA